MGKIQEGVNVNLYYHYNCSPGTNIRRSRSFYPLPCIKQLSLIIIILISSCCQWTVSDFNVLIPHICDLPKSIKLNFTWVYEMVHLGLRDKRTGINLNFLSPDEICDGSKGLLKFLSLGQEDPSGIMIASLEPQLCPVAAAFTQLRQRQFISWTCSEMPGIISLKPTNAEVSSSILQLIRYFNWKNVAIVKSKDDESSYCDTLGNDLNSNIAENISLVMLGNHENLVQNPLFSLRSLQELDGFFYCFSYGYGLKENILGKNNKKMWNTMGVSVGESWTFWGKEDENGIFERIPLVLLPEWPLPIEILTPDVPTMALIANPPSSSTSYEFEVTSWEQEQSARNNKYSNSNIENSPTPFTKMIELLLAQLILHSVKLGITFEDQYKETNTFPSSSWSSTPYETESNNNNIKSKLSFNSNPNSFETFAYPYNMKWEFFFSLAQYDNGRWHPLINLSDGEKLYSQKPFPKVPHSKTVHKTRQTNGDDFSGFEVKPWLQFIVGGIVMSGIVLILLCLSLYARKRIRRARGYDSSPTTVIRRKLSRRHRTQGPYKIILNSSDIVFGVGGESIGRKNSKPQFGNLRGPDEKPDLLKVPHGGLRKISSSSSILKSGSHHQINPNHCETKARYKGDLVHLRQLGGSPADSLQIKMKTMNILETLHGLRHENVTAMLGCFSENRPISLVWEYCSRGSLYDIIHMPDIKLDWPFKLSLLTDLVRGMRHLHLSLIRVHGKLTSRNCIVDARWVLKVTDYGIPSLCQAQGISPLPPKNRKDLLWTAPELLRDESLQKQGTQTGDVYSFAIIMQEVLIRGAPFCMLTLSVNEIIEKLKHPPPLIRPSVSKGAAPPEAINIMRQCWAELPDMRPDFTVIHDLFKTLNHGRKANIVDTMFQMLEKYSNNLEELIRERTEQLDLERKKTEQLLNRMLPSTVAEKLKVGLPVDPEDFPEVTIYFSDIVGFTTISAYSTPFEVVDLLNDLYTCFDATINDYNVYKVETIGDAYMVVGGAPVWSQDHADQIATMALDLLHQSGKFRIRHLPFTPLRLRIGIHSGPCCAGVVGLTMPRYCLFGDTVNTASRMESTGSAWRIHISTETKAILDSIGGYVIQYRGMTAIKGKGQMPTFWLLGKEGFDKELPKPPGPDDEKSCYLDEKSIMYGRTGVWPDSSCIVGNEFADVNNLGSNSNPSGSASALSPSGMTPSSHSNKPTSKYGLLSGTSPGTENNVRSLSPAEQVAHQLLTGKPAFKGLRRQFSLDQGTNSHLVVTKTNFKKAPSLDETSEYTQHNNSVTTTQPILLERAGSERKSSGESSESTNTFSSQEHKPQISLQTVDIKVSNSGNDNTANSSVSPSKLTRKGSGSGSKPILKTRTLSILEESPIHSRKGILKTTQSATD